MVNCSLARSVTGQVDIGAIMHTGTTAGDDHDTSTFVPTLSAIANIHVARGD